MILAKNSSPQELNSWENSTRKQPRAPPDSFRLLNFLIVFFLHPSLKLSTTHKMYMMYIKIYFVQISITSHKGLSVT